VTTAELKKIVQRYYDEIWTQGKTELIDLFFAPDYVNRDPATPAPNGEIHGREGMKGLVAAYRTTFPDLIMHIDGQVAEGDKVVSWWTASGTMSAPLNGIPANGKHGAVKGMTVTTFRNGEIVDDDVVWDLFGLLKQLELA
jgi:steroid delta-isomerase-like uncharacterized protein